MGDKTQGDKVEGDKVVQPPTKPQTGEGKQGDGGAKQPSTEHMIQGA